MYSLTCHVFVFHILPSDKQMTVVGSSSLKDGFRGAWAPLMDQTVNNSLAMQETQV